MEESRREIEPEVLIVWRSMLDDPSRVIELELKVRPDSQAHGYRDLKSLQIHRNSAQIVQFFVDAYQIASV